MADGILDEALERLRDTGPERTGWLANHAPMAAEALAWHGHAAQVHRWLDGYGHLLEERPRGISPIPRDQWRDPLGDPVRTGDWVTYFERELDLAPWRVVLETWWPRLLPGIAAGATHGVIRVGHAVRALLDVETLPRVVELAHGLAYWAARWQPLAQPAAGPYAATDPRAALDAVPLVPDQRFGIRHRLAQLATLGSWPSLRPPDDVEHQLGAIVDAAVDRNFTHGYGAPVMLVHAATAPTAVLRTLPALPERLWGPSLEAAWAATTAVTAAYSPAGPRAVTGQEGDPMEAAVRTGDAHAIKFADAAVDSLARTGDRSIPGRTVAAVALIAAD
jgi:hypothetical protein